MYAWIFRHLPGPTWFKVIESLVLIGAAVVVLFTWVYPWNWDSPPSAAPESLA